MANTNNNLCTRLLYVLAEPSCSSFDSNMVAAAWLLKHCVVCNGDLNYDPIDNDYYCLMCGRRISTDNSYISPKQLQPRRRIRRRIA